MFVSPTTKKRRESQQRFGHCSLNFPERPFRFAAESIARRWNEQRIPLRLFESRTRNRRGDRESVEEGSTGGASDGNFTSALGIPTLDGLGRHRRRGAFPGGIRRCCIAARNAQRWLAGLMLDEDLWRRSRDSLLRVALRELKQRPHFQPPDDSASTGGRKTVFGFLLSDLDWPESTTLSRVT